MRGYTLDDIKRRAERQRKRKDYRGWFEIPNAGNVPHNIEMFNQVSGASNLGAPPSLTGSCNGNSSSGGETTTTSMVESVQRWEKRFDLQSFERRQVRCLSNLKYKVVFASNERGTCPAKAYLAQLNSGYPRLYGKLIRTLLEVLQEGSSIGASKSKFLQDGILELQAQGEGAWARLLYFFDAGNLVVLTTGFNKDQDKTPPAEIEEARHLRDSYFKERR